MWTQQPAPKSNTVVYRTPGARRPPLFVAQNPPTQAQTPANRIHTTDMTSWSNWHRFVVASLILLALVLSALVIVYGVLEARDVRRIHRLERGEDSIGFFAYKNHNQTIPPNVYTTADDWSVDQGAPFYDNSNGAMDLTSGVWTTQVAGVYQVSAATCWTASGSLNTRRMIFATDGAGTVTASLAATVGYGQVCTTLSVPMRLITGMTLRVQVQRTSAGSELLDTLSSFGIERLG